MGRNDISGKCRDLQGMKYCIDFFIICRHTVDDYVSTSSIFNQLSPSQVNQSSLSNMREPDEQGPNIEMYSTTDYFYNPVTRPNSNYTFVIYVSNCAGDSDGTRAEGRCVTDVAGITIVL